MTSFSAFVYSWHVDDYGGIHAFALDEKNKTVHLEIKDFHPYVYMQLPENVNWFDPKNKTVISSYIEELRPDIKPYLMSFMNKKRLYDANVIPNPKYREDEKGEEKYIYKTYPYLFVAFNSTESLKGFVKQMSYNGIYIPSVSRTCKFKFHETLASPVLQFTCLRNIPMTGWITGTGVIPSIKTSICHSDYDVQWDQVFPCTDNSILKKVPCPKILMFDCEANSDNINTMPKNRPNDKIFQISFAVTSHGSNSIEKYLLSLGTLDQKAVGDDVILHTYKCEGDLLIGFSDLIKSIDPQVIGGYNILGWDFMYLIQRAKHNHVFTEFSNYGYLAIQPKEKNISWSSSAFNAQNFTFIDATGRLIIDMLPLIRRDFKMSRYDLGSVSTEILGQTKDPLTHKGIFKCYRIFSKESLSLVGKYCVNDSVVTLLLFDKLKTWVGMCQMSAIFNVGILDLYTQGQQMKIYSQVYRECLHNNTVVEQDAFTCGENETYTGAIVLEPTPGMYKDVVTFDFASLYPSVMMANNICYSTRVVNPDIPDEDCHIFEWEDHISCIVEGGFVTTEHESVPIETLKDNSIIATYGKNGVISGTQSNFFNQGVKKCVKLTMFDGTELKCTPDHRILTTDGWKEAQDLIIGTDKVLLGVQPPRVDLNSEIQPYTFSIGDKIYSLNSSEERKKSLAISRILGLILSDGSVAVNGTNIYCGCKIDCQSIVSDLQKIVNVDISTRQQSHCFSIHVPQVIAKNIHLTDGITFGKRSIQPYSLPTFLEDAPLCILREFLGGLFGGDGHTLSYGKKSKSFGHIGFSKTVICEHLDSLIQYMKKLQVYLSKFSIETTIIKRPEKLGRDEVYLMVTAQDTVKFYESIGFRHCAHKSSRLMVGVSYYRYHQNIDRQRRQVVDRVKSRGSKTIDQAVSEAHEELKNTEYIYNLHYSLPKTSAVVDMMRPRRQGSKTSFQKKYGVLLAEEYIKFVNAESLFFDGYAVKPNDTESPVIGIPVVKITDIGMHQTYDIEVEDTHSFLCNGIIVHNCSHDTSVRTTKPKNIICAKRKYRFLKSPAGILPTLLKRLISERKTTKKEGEAVEEKAKQMEDCEEKKSALMYAMVCDMKQLALKVSSNSMYGGMGVRKGKLPFMPGAMCTTAGGRDAIMTAKKLITEKSSGTTVYGDTDSLMYIFDNMERFRDENGKTDYKALEEYSCRVAQDISKEFPAPMKLEYENIAEDFFILTKKRYMTKLTTGKYKKRGIMITRRDNALICRNVYEGLLKCIFAYKSKEDTIFYLLQSLNEIYSYTHPTKTYCITKSIKELEEYKIKALDTDPEKRKKQFALKFLSEDSNEADYQIRSLPAHVQLAERMRRRGMFVEAGSRIDFVVTTVGGAKGKMWQKIESSEYYKEHSDILRLDMNYYCKSLMNPCDQVLQTAFNLKNFMKEQLEFRLLKQECIDELNRIFITSVDFIE